VIADGPTAGRRARKVLRLGSAFAESVADEIAEQQRGIVVGLVLEFAASRRAKTQSEEQIR
jgi:hypothetical protein